jgi:hypothetical protein
VCTRSVSILRAPPKYSKSEQSIQCDIPAGKRSLFNAATQESQTTASYPNSSSPQDWQASACAAAISPSTALMRA